MFYNRAASMNGLSLNNVAYVPYLGLTCLCKYVIKLRDTQQRTNKNKQTKLANRYVIKTAQLLR